MFNISNRRFVGSKLKLANWIIESINKNCAGNVFFEVFAGTSIISSQIAAQMKRIIINDSLQSNNVIYEAFYRKGTKSQSKLDKYKTKFNNLKINSGSKGWFAKNYGGKYFGVNDCKTIEAIRGILLKDKKKLTKKEYNILLASLIYSMDRIANTVGHFDAYIQKQTADDLFAFDLIQPLDLDKTEVDIYCSDANALAEKVQADIAYIDPPYNSRQYCQFYHIYETVIKWDNPELSGTALKRKGESLSEYCRTKAPVVFADLIKKIKCKYIVVSYNNTYKSKSKSSRNKIKLDEIKKILSEYGKIKTLSKSHRAFNSGKTDLPDHKEYLFIVKKGSKKSAR